MAHVALITDSSACLSPSLRDSLPLHVLPIRIHLPSHDLDDHTPNASALVYEALGRGEPVKSSAPTALDYLAAAEDAQADAVVIVTPAEEFTGMHRSALFARDMASRPVKVVDCRSAAAAQGLAALAAAEAAAEGASIDEVAATAEDVCRRTDLVASLESLEHVQRSGRVSPAALGLARRLGVRPVFRLFGGTVERLGVPRSEAAALRRIHREWAAGGGATASRCAVFHAACPDRADDLNDSIGGQAMKLEFSASMGIHTGPGLVGVAWLRDPA